MNELIVNRIKDARKERGLTQQDLANLLNRTASAISDLERGKVQVSASDLYEISKYFHKPIEFFFGEDFKDDNIDEIITLIRRQPKEAQKESIEIIKIILSMQDMGRVFLDDNKEPTIEELQEFFNSFIKFSKKFNEINDQTNMLRDSAIQALKEQGIDLINSKKDE